MPKYRKNPVVIEAVQYDGTNEKEIELFVNKTIGVSGLTLDYDPKVKGYFIRTLEGRMTVSEGDYVIKGVEGEFYPCKPDIFEKTYTKVEDE